jgi:hypothetical protein
MDRKYKFLKEEFVPLLRELPSEKKGRWGVLNAQQMVEHFSDSVKIASGRLAQPAVVEGETLEKYREFLMSDKPFKENTKNPYMTEEPAALRCPDMEAALDELQKELDYFFFIFEDQGPFTTLNPFFGELDFQQNIQLLYKHAIHHLRQFGLME